MQAFRLECPTGPREVKLDELAASGIFHRRVPVSAGWEERLADATHTIGLDGPHDDVALVSGDAANEPFAKEHRHAFAEARYITSGMGLFDVRNTQDEWVRLFVTAGDLIVIPARRWHRFFVLGATIKVRRLFGKMDRWHAEWRDPKDRPIGRV